MSFRVALIAIYSVESAGIRYLSAALRRAGHDTRLLFLRDWVHNRLQMPSDRDVELLLEHLAEYRPDLVGLSLMSSLFPMARELTTRIRAALPGVPVIWGGIHPTSAPEDCIEHVDYLCLGEGEQALVDLCDALRDGEDSTTIASIWARRDGVVHRNPVRAPIADLDSLPWPDLDDHNKVYIEHGRARREEPWKRSAEYRVYTSRGCPCRCAYCYVTILRDLYRDHPGPFYRVRSVEHVLGELEHVKRHFPRLARVKIDDDTSFAAGGSWVEAFVASYPQRIGLPFECLLIPPMLQRALLAALKQAGLVRVQVGIESGSPAETRHLHHRAPGNEDILAFAELNRELGLDVVYDVIIDNPAATEEMKLETARFLVDLPRPYSVYFYSLNYFPGTALTRAALAEGTLDPAQVEGRSTKAWHQFRVSMDWPRSDEDRFYLAIYCLASKSFVSRRWLHRLLDDRELHKRNVEPLYYLAWGANYLRMTAVALDYLRRGELTRFKVRQYGSLLKLISQ